MPVRRLGRASRERHFRSVWRPTACRRQTPRSREIPDPRPHTQDERRKESFFRSLFLRRRAVWYSVTRRSSASPPLEGRGHELEAFEDMLDAVVCAWIGACVLDGRARAYGDEASAIWVPRPQ
ncbi:DUF429 domain-containing protein [Neorhizobium galegae]|nr:DUF429 domain-containing protein [Neorhizobium galegae]MCM2500652.1 DUF429 domain-containing protein [Neorhizobium galegae]